MPLTAQLAGNAQPLAWFAVTASPSAADHPGQIRPSGQATGVARARAHRRMLPNFRCLRT